MGTPPTTLDLLKMHWLLGQIELARPAWLAGLVLLAPIVYYARRSLSDLSRNQRAASTVVRALLLVLLVLAICGLSATYLGKQKLIVIAVDQSLSIGDGARQAADRFLDEAEKRAAGDDRIAYVAFAGKAQASTGRPRAEEDLHRQQTNFAAAIELLGRVSTPDYVVRRVLLTDGHENQGNALDAAQKAGVPISIVPLPGTPEREIRDTLAGSNRASTSVLATPAPRALLVEGQPGIGRRLAAALRVAQINIETRDPAGLPGNPDVLAKYDLLVLVNVPAALLGAARMQAVQAYVEQRGGGLLVIGGDQAFTPGGYGGTALQEVLPVTAYARQKPQRPDLAMVLVIDRSESMEGPRIELAKEATRRAVEILGPQDQLGVIAFEDASYWVSPIHLCADKQRVLQGVAALKAEGRTNMYPAMEKAYLALDEAFAQRKHMIVLTDGISHVADFSALASRIASSGITISMVGIGEAAGPVLEQLARIGHGRYYDCKDAKAVPQVFELETISASQQGISEEAFAARVSDTAREQLSIDASQLPVLLGNAETQARPGAEVLLACQSGDPLLACWSRGRGTAVAFTSDVQPRWAAAWLDWAGFDRFWSQVARRAMRKARGPATADASRGAPDHAPEFRLQPTNTRLLQAIAEATHGRYDPAPAELFAAGDEGVPRRMPLASYLLASAAVLLVIDLSLRRIRFGATP